MAATTSTPITMLQLPELIGSTIRGMTEFQAGPALEAMEILAVSDTKRRFQTGTDPNGRVWMPLAHNRIISRGADKPLRDTGILMASVTAKASRTELVVGTNLAHAGVHQWGATIRPTKAKFLSIPMTKEAKYAGSPRRFPRELHPRINRRGTGGVLIEINGDVEIVQYVLTKQVVVPARPFLGFSREFLGQAEQILCDIAVRHMGLGDSGAGRGGVIPFGGAGGMPMRRAA